MSSYCTPLVSETNFELMPETGSSGSGGGFGEGGVSPIPSPLVPHQQQQDSLVTDETGCLVSVLGLRKL